MHPAMLGDLNESAAAEATPVVKVEPVQLTSGRTLKAGMRRIHISGGRKPRQGGILVSGGRKPRQGGAPAEGMWLLQVQGIKKILAEGLAMELTKAVETFIPLFVSARAERRAVQVEELAQLLGGNVAIQPFDQRIALGYAEARKAILEGTRWLTAAEVASLSGTSDADRPEKRVYAWRDRGKVFSLKLDDGIERFPLYAFDQGGQPHEVMQEILSHLGKINSWRIASWFNSNLLSLGGRAPRELLETDPEAVLEVAKNYNHFPG
jgi:hypothetical protein